LLLAGTVAIAAADARLEATLGVFPGRVAADAPTGKMTATQQGGKISYQVEAAGINPFLKASSWVKYKGYQGTDADGIVGTFTVEQGSRGMLYVTHDLKLNETDTQGGIRIHAGKDCDADAGAAWYGNEVTANNWATTVWKSDSEGQATGEFNTASGYEYADNLGHTVIILNSLGDKIACGILDDAPNGFHVHEGSSCATHEDVKGHFWKPTATVNVDPWTTSISTAGKTTGTATFADLDDGHSFDEHVGRTVVLHAGDGTRIGCGVLSLLGAGNDVTSGTTVAPGAAATSAAASEKGDNVTTGTTVAPGTGADNATTVAGGATTVAGGATTTASTATTTTSTAARLASSVAALLAASAIAVAM